MNNVRRLKDRSLIEDEAAAWVWRLDDEPVSANTLAAYEAWLKEDPRHGRVIEEYRALWGRLDSLQTLCREERIRTVSRGIDEQEGDRAIPSARRYGAIAACLVLTVAVLVFAGRPALLPVTTADTIVASAERVHETLVGEFRTVTLDDGSVIEMNTDTKLTVIYGTTARRIELERGEAHFNVAKDPQWPFVVTANGAAVRAVGTAFNVRSMRDAPTEVLVTEGTVEVTEYGMSTEVPGPSRDSEQVYLTAGQSIRVDQTAPAQIASISPGDLDRELAWRKGMLIFEGEPLANVVEELSRYTDIRFVFIDDAIRQRRVGGYFRTGDVETLLSVLEEGLSIRIERQGNDLILLSDATKEGPGQDRPHGIVE